MTAHPGSPGSLVPSSADKSWFDVRRQWWVILSCIVFGVAASWAYTVQVTPLYQSSVRVLLYGKVVPRAVATPTPGASTLKPAEDLYAAAALNQAAGLSRVKIRTYAELAISNQVIVPIMNDVGWDGGPDQFRGRTQVLADVNAGALTISVQDSDPHRAARAAAGVARATIQVVGDLERQGSGNALVHGMVLRDAEVATLPFWPRLDLNLAVGFMAGLVVGTGLATMRDQLDTRIRGERQLFDVALTWPLACVPTIARGKEERRTQAVSRLAIALGYGSPQGGPRTLLLTSPRPDREKPLLARDLAGCLHRMDRKVLLVDCDLRSGHLTEAMGRRNDEGLSDSLAHLAPMESLIRASEVGADVLGAGRRPPNPVELLASRSMADLWARWSGMYDVVLLDCPPALEIADALTLVPRGDGVVCIVRDGMTRRHDLTEALRLLGGSRGRAPEVVLLGGVSARSGASIDVTLPTTRRRSMA